MTTIDSTVSEIVSLVNGDKATREYVRDAVMKLAKDAERYRWLKANHLQTGPDSWIRTGDDLEEAIDAAIIDRG